jgi:hypothetical protein
MDKKMINGTRNRSVCSRGRSEKSANRIVKVMKTKFSNKVGWSAEKLKPADFAYNQFGRKQTLFQTPVKRANSS